MQLSLSSCTKPSERNHGESVRLNHRDGALPLPYIGPRCKKYMFFLVIGLRNFKYRGGSSRRGILRPQPRQEREGRLLQEAEGVAARSSQRGLRSLTGVRFAAGDGTHSLTRRALNERVNRLISFIQASGVRVGERVAVESHIPCGQCRICRTHRAHICPDTRYPGVDIDGGFAAFAVLPAEIVIPLPTAIEPRIAALFEPFGIAVHASLEGGGVAGRHVLISGCGPIGLLNVIAARALGARRITATDINPRRLAAAVAAGAGVEPAWTRSVCGFALNGCRVALMN